MRAVLTFARAAPALSPTVHLDFALNEVSRAGVRLRLSKLEFRLLVLMVVSPTTLTSLQLAELLYADDAGGGPDYSSECIRHAVYRLRRRVSALGICIRSQGNGNPSGYWAEETLRWRRHG